MSAENDDLIYAYQDAGAAYLGPDPTRHRACWRCGHATDPFEDFWDVEQPFGPGVTCMKRRVECPGCGSVTEGLTP